MQECPECGRLYPDAVTACPEDGESLELPAESDPYLGRTVGSYVLVQKLGTGGMGQVYLGEHPQIGSHVAIKLLHPRFSADPAIVDRFFNEACAANVIGHEGIVQIFDFGRLPEGVPYFVMEWLQGAPLSARMGTPMPLAEAAPIALQISSALQAAHEAGVVHRDLKPDNIFLVPRQNGAQVKLLDFGIAKLNADTTDPGVTRSGVVMGTARYLSPEQAAGDASRVSAASDIYSLGVILFQLATGVLPFSHTTYAEQLTAHLREAPRSPRSIVPAIPPPYEAVILRCLEKKPENRFASMRDLHDAIVQLVAAPSSVPLAIRSRSRATRVAAVVVLVASASAGVWWWSRSKEQPVAAAEPERNVAVASPSPVTTPTPIPRAIEPTPEPVIEMSPSPSPMPVIARPTATKKEKKPAPPKKTAPSNVGNGFIDVNF